MQFFVTFLRKQSVAFLRAEMWKIDTGQRISCFHPEKRTAGHILQAIACF